MPHSGISFRIPPARRSLRMAAGLVVVLAALSAMAAIPSPPRAFGDTAGGVQSPSDSVGTAVPDSAAVADSLAAPEPPRIPPPSKAFGHLETGKALYETTCLPCHGASGEGNKDIGAPALNRQEPWYLLTQLRNEPHLHAPALSKAALDAIIAYEVISGAVNPVKASGVIVQKAKGD